MIYVLVDNNDITNHLIQGYTGKTQRIVYLHDCTYICRWSKPGCLEITISAHSTQHSLLQLTGLASLPKTILSSARSGKSTLLTSVHSIADMKLNSEGAYVTERINEDCYTLYISLNNKGLGHCITLFM